MAIMKTKFSEKAMVNEKVKQLRELMGPVLQHLDPKKQMRSMYLAS